MAKLATRKQILIKVTISLEATAQSNQPKYNYGKAIEVKAYKKGDDGCLPFNPDQEDTEHSLRKELMTCE